MGRSEAEVLEDKVKELELELEVNKRLLEGSQGKVSDNNLQVVKLLGAIDSGPSQTDMQKGDFGKHDESNLNDTLNLTDIELNSLIPRLKVLAKMAGDNFSLNNSVMDTTDIDESRITLGENTLDLLGITPIARNPKNKDKPENCKTDSSNTLDINTSSTPKETLFEALIS